MNALDLSYVGLTTSAALALAGDPTLVLRNFRPEVCSLQTRRRLRFLLLVYFRLQCCTPLSQRMSHARCRTASKTPSYHNNASLSPDES